jgi:beta-galactosidase
MGLTMKSGNFCLDGREFFLNSGEIHYFRIKRDLWSKHIKAAADAGLTCVSTYVPWAWHEPAQGKFDFDGITTPERDLNAWIKLCREAGLKCILKPGPFILAETRGAGLPSWFLEEYEEEVRMRNKAGLKVASDGVTLFNPKFLKYVSLWYDQVMPLIARNQHSNGGPVILMQVCNEIGVFSWLAHQADYNTGVKEKFVGWLKEKYKSIAKLNQVWNTDYTDFEFVELPPDGRMPYVSKFDRARDFDWHRVWRSYYGEYLRMLSGMARDRGVDVPLYHNLPGWIYGSGYEFPVNITMYDDLFGDWSEMLFGVDHIPEYLSYRNMHDDRIINDITSAMMGNKPLFAAEFQCGSREYHVVTNPREMELFYKASLIHGLKGWNYYMFSQGRNPRHRGYSGDTFYWFNPLTPEGEKTEAFPLVSKMSRIIASAEDHILKSSRKAEVCVLFYPHYYATELERPEAGQSGLVFNPSAIRRPAYFDGLLKVLQLLNVDYDMADLTRVSASELSRYRQVWSFTTDEMDGKDQQVLVDYLQSGGNLVLYPAMPDREMNQQPCTLLRDAIGINPAGIETIDSPLIDILGNQDIKCANPQVIFSEVDLHGAEVIARTIRGNVCGFVKPVGTGRLLYLGTWLGFDTEGHRAVYQDMLEQSGAHLKMSDSDNPNLSVRERFSEDSKGVLFVGNYYNEDQTGSIRYTHPKDGSQVSIPYGGEPGHWPPLYGIITPVCLDILPGLTLLHCTSDLLSVSINKDCVEFTLIGDRDLTGEMVLEGSLSAKIAGAVLNGQPLESFRDQDRLVFGYSHDHNKEMTLRINLAVPNEYQKQ